MKNFLTGVIVLSLIWLGFVAFSVLESVSDWKVMVEKQLHQHVFEIDRLERRMDEGCE